MSKRYKCPQCEYRGTKEELISHFEDKHSECIPKGYTAGRVIFNHINKKTHGTCVVCKRETKWNENTLKYDRLCGRKECKDSLRKFYQKNMIRVRGTDNILTDPEQQEKMLRNRRISGKYKFTDGGVHIYTGSYEEKTLEFLDKVLHFSSYDILAPGPVLEYEYKGKLHKFITDIFIIPLNLIIEVKDGGDNKNNRPMQSYREKQIEKENAVKRIGKYNYLRLTNNNFVQLLEIMTELKYQSIDDSTDKSVIINIHEEVHGLYESYGLSNWGSLHIDPYTDALNVYNSLNRNVQLWVAPNGRFVDSPLVKYRDVGYQNQTNPACFIEWYDTSPDEAFIIYAVKPEFQGHGISQILLKAAANDAASHGKKKLIYRVSKDNIKSIKAAIKFGFKEKENGKEDIIFEYSLRGWKNVSE